jgi:signal transduction histidine kinase
MTIRRKSAAFKEQHEPGVTRESSRPRISAMSRDASIARAKLEWEGTVDALTSLVCLLDRDGKILRTNRVAEDWSMGRVHDVIGLDAHELLHATCGNPACELAAFMRNALHALQSGTKLPSEMHLGLGPRNLKLMIMPMRIPSAMSVSKSDALAVLVANDVTALDRAHRALEEMNVTLEGRVNSRTQALAQANLDLRNEISRRELAERQLRRSRDDLAALSAQLIGAQEVERKRIAQELHDSVGQSLSAAKYTVERGLELLRQPDPEKGIAALSLAVSRIQEAAESIRTISMDLRPAILDDLGVVSALQWFCREFALVYPTLEISEQFEVQNHEVPDRLATVVYRCAQELLNNVAKHASATRVQVRLSQAEGALDFQVSDNGVGFAQISRESPHRGSGLRNLHERAKLTGGTFEITPAEGGGTIARLAWQLMSRDTPRKRQPARESSNGLTRR